MLFRILLLFCVLIIGTKKIAFSQLDTVNAILKNSCRLDSIFKNDFQLFVSKIYMYGEFHDQRGTTDIALDLCNKAKNQGRIVYATEMSKSIEYFLKNHLESGRTKYSYNDIELNIFIYGKIKRLFRKIDDWDGRDSTIIRGFDIEENFSFSLMALFDILKHSKKSTFIAELKSLKDNQGRNRSKNESNYEISHWVIDKFRGDSSKYQNNLSKNDYYYYSGIIRSLEQGLIVDSMITKVHSNFAKAFYTREIFLKENTHKIISEETGSIFIHCGLIHLLDPGFYYGTKNYETLGAYLKNTYGSKNVCRIGSISKRNDYYNEQILSPTIVQKLKRRMKNKYTWIDFRTIPFATMSKLDYAVFFK